MANQYFPSQIKQYENVAENVALNRGRDPDTIVNPLSAQNQIKMDRDINVRTPDLSFDLGDFSTPVESPPTPYIPTPSVYPEDFTSNPFGLPEEPPEDPEEQYQGFWQFNISPREAKNIVIGGALGQWYSMKTGLRNVFGISPDIGQREIEQRNVRHFLNDLSDEAKASLQKDFIYKDKETGEFHVGGDLSTILGALLMSGPGTLLTLMGGGVGGLLLKRFAGMSANAAGALSFGTSSAITSGLTQAGNVYNSIIDLPMESVEKSPLFQKIYNRILLEKPNEDPEYVKEFAKDFLAKQLSFEAGIVTGSFTGLTEAAIGGVLLRGTENAIDLTRRMFGMNGIASGNGMELIGKIAKGAGIEGITEGFQNSFLEGVVNRYQRHRAGEDVEPYDGVWNDAALGIVTGSTMAGTSTLITGGIAMPFQMNKKDVLDSIMAGQTKAEKVVEKINLDSIEFSEGASELNREYIEPIKDFVSSISDRLPATFESLRNIKKKVTEVMNDINVPESVVTRYSAFKNKMEDAIQSKESLKSAREAIIKEEELNDVSPDFEVIEEPSQSGSLLHSDTSVKEVSAIDIPTPLKSKTPLEPTPASDTLWSTPEQKITSQETSINSKKLPATFKIVQKIGGWISGHINADIGGGSFDNFTNALLEIGVQNVVYDPFNRSPEHNQSAVNTIKDGGADTVTINNLLNVIEETENQEQILRQAENALREGGTVYIKIYEGKGDGQGLPTGKGFQHNKKTKSYLNLVSRFFPNAKVSRGLIIATKEQSFVPAKAEMPVGKFLVMDNTGDKPKLVKRAMTRGEAEIELEKLQITYNQAGKDFYQTKGNVASIPEAEGAKLRSKTDSTGKSIMHRIADKLFKKASFLDKDAIGRPVAIKEFLREIHNLIVQEDMYMPKLVLGSVKEKVPHLINLSNVQNIRTLVHEIGHSILFVNKMLETEVKNFLDSLTEESVSIIDHLIPATTIKYLRDQLLSNKYNWFDAHINTKKAIIKKELGLVPKKKSEWGEVQQNGKTYEEMIMDELWNLNRSTNRKFIHELFAEFYSAYIFNPTWTRATFPQLSGMFNKYLNRTNLEGGKVNYKLQELTEELINSTKIWNRRVDAEKARAKIGGLNKTEKRAIRYPDGISFKTLGEMLGLSKAHMDQYRTRFQNWWHPVTLMYKDLAFEEVIGEDGKPKMVERKLFSILKDPRKLFQLLAGDGKEIEHGILYWVASFNRYKFWEIAKNPELLKKYKGLLPRIQPVMDLGIEKYNDWKVWVRMITAEELALHSKERLFTGEERRAIYKEIGIEPKKERIGQYFDAKTGKAVSRFEKDANGKVLLDEDGSPVKNKLIEEVYEDGEFSHNEANYIFRGKTIMSRDANGNQEFIINEVEGPLTKDEKLIYIKHQRELVEFHNLLADYAVDAGLLSEESRENFKKYINYIPSNRVNPRSGKIDGETEDMKSYGKWKAKSIWGSTLNVLDPIENTIMNYASLVHSARRNEALNSLIDFNYLMDSDDSNVSVDEETGQANLDEAVKDDRRNPWIEVKNAKDVKAYKILTKVVLQTLQKQGLQIDLETDESPLEYMNAFQTFFLPDMSVANPNEEGKLISTHRQKNQLLIKRNGKSYVLQVNDELLLESLDSMYSTRIDNGILNFLFRGSRMLARLKRGSIVMEPVFQVRNFLRDTQAAYFYSEAIGDDAFGKDMSIPFASSIEGAKIFLSKRENDLALKNLLAWSGAGFGSKIRENVIDHEDRINELKDIHGRKGDMSFAKGMEFVERFSSMPESAARMKEFYLVLAKELSQRISAIEARYMRLDKDRRKAYQESVLQGKELVTEDESLRFMALNKNYEFKGQQWKDLKTGKIIPASKVAEKAREIERLEIKKREHEVKQARAEAIMMASLAYREVSTDFGKIGSNHLFRRYAQITTFLNPHIQGTFKFGETLINHKKRTMLRAMPLVGVTLAAHLLHKSFDDDKDYEDRPNWDTLTYLNLFKFSKDDPIGATFGALGFKHEGMLRIPKAWEPGYIFQTLPQLWTDYFIEMNGENNPLKKKAIREVALAGAYSLIGDAPLPTVIQPLVELAWNRSIWLDRPIEPEYMRGTAPEKFGPSTPELFRDISRHFEGLGLNISPVQLEHISHAYLGGLSLLLVAGVDDIFYKRETHTDDSFMERMMSPFIGKGVMSTSEVGDFYDAYRDLRDLNASLKSIQEEYPRDPERAKERMKEFQGRHPMWAEAGILSKEFRDLSSEMTQLRQQKRDAIRDAGRSDSAIDNMSADEIHSIRRKHRDKVNELVRMMNAKYKEIMQTYRRIVKEARNK